MRDCPLVSIITVCRNPGLSLEKTVQSVSRQHYQKIEYIVIDGASSDGTIEWLKNSKQAGNITKIISEKDSGIYAAINKGIGLSTGELVGILHAGDTYELDAVSHVVDVFLNFKKESSVIAGSINIVSDHGKNKIYQISAKGISGLSLGMSLYHPSIFITRNAYLRSGLYQENYRICGDFELLHRFYSLNENFQVTSKVLSNMEYGGVSTQFKYIFIAAKECSEIVFPKESSIRKKWMVVKYVIINGLSIFKKNILKMI